MPPNIVTIGGGTGTYTVLSALKTHMPDAALTAIVSMADDGGSSGILRDELGALPPGDARRALLALSEAEHVLRKLLDYRFPDDMGGLAGHNFGNLLIAALEHICGGFGPGIEEASRILRVRGTVLPVTLDSVRLFAELEDGSIIRGETNIDVPKHNPELRITRVWLDPKGRLNPRVLTALSAANLVIIGPGDLYTSIIPNLLIPDMREALRSASGRIVYFANLMTKYGETNRFTVHDFARVLSRYLSLSSLRAIIWNTEQPTDDRLKFYATEHSEYVSFGRVDTLDDRVAFVGRDLITTEGLIRHDHQKLAEAIREFLPPS